MHAPVKAERTVDVKPLNFLPSPFSTALLKPISKMYRIALSLALDQENSLSCMNKRDILDHLTQRNAEQLYVSVCRSGVCVDNDYFSCDRLTGSCHRFRFRLRASRGRD